MSQAVSLTALRERIGQIEWPARHGVLPFGVAAIDRALPGGGLALGAVHEILGQGGDEEDGAATASFVSGILARLGPHPAVASASATLSRNAGEGYRGAVGSFSLSRTAGEGARGHSPRAGEGSGPVLWCLKRPDLYGPGLAAHGLDPGRLVIVAAPRDKEILWAIEEGLRLPGLAAVVGEVGRLPMVAGRRLQLAAERSGVTALVLRRWRNGGEAAAERERPSAAVTRWRVTSLPSRLPPIPSPAPSLTLPRSRGREGWRLSGGGLGWGLGQPRWRVELLRCRGGVPAAWDVEVADASGHVSVSAGLADRSAPPLQRSSEPRVRRFG